MRTTGDAPCGKCQLHISDIALIPDSKEQAGDGGWWWQAEPGQTCPTCGEPLIWFHKPPLPKCHDCQAAPGEQHMDGCDTEQCSVCGGQRLMCWCAGHDKEFAKWTGHWPGKQRADELGIDLNELHRLGLHKPLFIKGWVPE